MFNLNYKLSCQLQQHSSDVRALTSLPDGRFISASRDRTAVLWIPAEKRFAAQRIFSQHEHYLAAVAYAPPTDAAPQGYAITAGFDKVIRQWDLSRDDSEPLVIGTHDKEISCIAVLHDTTISGSWDSSVRVWRDGSMVRQFTFDTHSVLCVLPLPDGTLAVGLSDKSIRIVALVDGSSVATVTGHDSVVRALCLWPNGFASAGNDGFVKVWEKSGSSYTCKSSFAAHDSLIYTMAPIEGGFLATGSEDRSVCILHPEAEMVLQRIAHPSNVWSVVQLSNGDIVTGCSDSVIRVFTRASDRFAIPEEDMAYLAQVASAPMHESEVSDMQVETPDALKQPGTKEGQLKVVGQEAYQWSMAEEKWLKIGDVVAPDGSGGADSGDQPSQGRQYPKQPKNPPGFVRGRKYDFVFDVQLNEDEIKQLGFNRGENPYLAAQRFIDEEEMPQTFLDEIADWVMQHVPKNELSVPGTNVDPLTAGHSYSNVKALSSVYTTFDKFAADGLKKKLAELNEIVDTSLKMTPKELSLINSLADTLGKTSFYHATNLDTESVNIVIRKLLLWPAKERFPALDLARQIAVHPSGSVLFASNPQVFESAVQSVQEMRGSTSPSPNIMLSMRLFANALASPRLATVAIAHVGNALEAASNVAQLNSPTRIAIAAVVANTAILIRLRGSELTAFGDLRIQCVAMAGELLQHPGDDVEVDGLSLVAVGNAVAGDVTARDVACSLEINQRAANLTTHADTRIREAAGAVIQAIETTHAPREM